MLGWEGEEARWEMNNEVVLQGPERDLPEHRKPHSEPLPSLKGGGGGGGNINLKPVMENLHSRR